MIDPEDYVAGPARDLLESAGRELTLIDTTVVTDADGNVVRDEYRDPETEQTETTVRGELVVRGTPQYEQRAGRADIDVSAFVWISSEYDDLVHEGSGDRAATKVRVNDDEPNLETDTLDVVDVVDEGNGKLRLVCQE